MDTSAVPPPRSKIVVLPDPTGTCATAPVLEPMRSIVPPPPPPDIEIVEIPDPEIILFPEPVKFNCVIPVPTCCPPDWIPTPKPLEILTSCLPSVITVVPPILIAIFASPLGLSYYYL